MSDLPDIGAAAPGSDPAKLRFVQFQGRRHAIRIEPAFWAALEDAAADLGLRLNRLVAALAARPEGKKNLSALLRLFALERTRRQLADSRQTGAGIDIATLVSASTAPALVFGGDRRIGYLNDLAVAWTSTKAGDLEGRPVEEFFRLRLQHDERNPWRLLETGDPGPFDGNIAYMPPGQLLARPIRACAIEQPRMANRAFVVFVR
jgi:predicted DNA-binding ribbon-helix-helix protein